MPGGVGGGSREASPYPDCGETLFAGPVVDKLNSLLWSMVPATRIIQASVYELSVA